MSVCVYIYIYICIASAHGSRPPLQGNTSANLGLRWILSRGGCSWRGVQWIGVVLHSKLVYNIIQFTTPCFHCTPLCRM